MSLDSKADTAHKKSSVVLTLRLFIWIYIIGGTLFIGAGWVSPAFGRLDMHGRLSAALCWNVYWLIWAPLNTVAWFIMVFGGPIFRVSRTQRILRLAAWGIVLLYWTVTVLGWGWLCEYMLPEVNYSPGPILHK